MTRPDPLPDPGPEAAPGGVPPAAAPSPRDASPAAAGNLDALAAGPTIHATAVVLDGSGVLIRGPSGAGKSTLALALIERWRAEARFAALVADDRVHLTVAAGRLVAATPAPIAGLVEVRGRGIITVPFERAAVIRLVVDLTAEPGPRLPEPGDATTTVHGVELPRQAFATGDERKVDVVKLLLVNRISAMT